jgi:hypothetical protein
MPVSQFGSQNATALIVPDVYVQIQEPQVALINGLPTDIVGIVGGASWGPKNSAVLVGSMADYAVKFGGIKALKYDAGTLVACAAQQGAANFRVVRASDGTDTAALVDIGPGTLLLTAKYTGTLGNLVTVSQSVGSKAGSAKITVSLPGVRTEIFDNIVAVGGKLSIGIANAINQGVGALRGPSNLLVAVGHGTESGAFTTGTISLAGGTDGWPSTDAHLVGADAGARSGMFALRGTNVSVACLADVTDPTTFSTQAQFGLAEGVYMVATGPAGETLDSAVANKASAGIDSYSLRLMFGDWILWADPVNQVSRLVSPQGFMVGRLANLSPENSALNKQLYSVAGTQRSLTQSVYGTAELGQLALAGIDVIANPCPGGAYFGSRLGHNTSSNPLTHGDNYTRLTNYIAFTLNSVMGRFVGKLQSPTVRAQAKGALISFLANMEQQGMIGNANGGAAFSVQLDERNNPTNRVALGYMQADVRVTYLSVVEKFLVNLEGSQATVIRTSTTGA